jgi:hypothetical protein
LAFCDRKFTATFLPHNWQTISALFATPVIFFPPS